MADDNKLVVTLEAYARQLQEHLAALRVRHENLELAWGRLRDIYEGEAAQAFGEAFETASAKLAAYCDQAPNIVEQLEAKIAQLRQVQSEGSDL